MQAGGGFNHVQCTIAAATNTCSRFPGAVLARQPLTRKQRLPDFFAAQWPPTFVQAFLPPGLRERGGSARRRYQMQNVAA
jgi:hypothetical protein